MIIAVPPIVGGIWSDFATSEFTLRVLSPVLAATITSLIVNGLARRRDRKERRRDAVSDELKTCISTLQELSAALALSVEEHLLGIPEGPIKESQQRIGIKTKALGRQLNDCKAFLAPIEATTLENAFHTWIEGLTGDGYPIQNKSVAFKPHDAIIKRVRDAQSEWQQFLLTFKVRCISGSLILETLPRR